FQSVFSLTTRLHPRSTLFPYTTLFRSRQGSNRSDPTSIKSSCESEAVPGKTLSAPRLFAHFRALSSTGSNFAVQTSKEVRPSRLDRKSTRLNSSHVSISYAVFCLKKKN